ncbi:MAG: hypothetical protein ABSC05_13865 [Candidatus Solibacter sp.]|jgi:hypothetical protein
MKLAGKTPCPVDEPQLQRRIAHDYFVRFHMSVILAAVISSGVLVSKLLMELRIPLHLRYPIAVLASYCVFLVLVRVWIWYVSVRTAAGLQLANLSFGGGRGSGGSGGSLDIGGGFSGGSGSGGSGSGGGFSGFGGGTSGGGGASSSWEGNDAAAIVSQPSSGSSGGHWWPDIDFGGGDDDSWLVIALLIALVACILGGGVYLVYAAPHILPEAAGQVLLAGTLKQASRQQHHTWVDGLIWSTWIPFVLVMIIAGALGWEAHRHCPVALRLLEVLNCPAN